VTDTPPRRRPWARTLEQRLADVEMAPEIWQAVLRYIQTRAAVLRPKTVDSLVNDLLAFAEYLTARHPASPACGNSNAATSRATWPGTVPVPGAADGRRRQRSRHLDRGGSVGGAQPS